MKRVSVFLGPSADVPASIIVCLHSVNNQSTRTSLMPAEMFSSAHSPAQGALDLNRNETLELHPKSYVVESKSRQKKQGQPFTAGAFHPLSSFGLSLLSPSIIPYHIYPANLPRPNQSAYTVSPLFLSLRRTINKTKWRPLCHVMGGDEKAARQRRMHQNAPKEGGDCQPSSPPLAATNPHRQRADHLQIGGWPDHLACLVWPLLQRPLAPLPLPICHPCLREASSRCQLFGQRPSRYEDRRNSVPLAHLAHLFTKERWPANLSRSSTFHPRPS